jgi:hypothetical protein
MLIGVKEYLNEFSGNVSCDRRIEMNPGGPVEEAGSTARSLIGSLSTTPMILALVVFNLFYIGMSTWLQLKQGERFVDSQATWERIVERAMAYCPDATKKP